MVVAGGGLAGRVVAECRQARQQQVHDSDLERHLAQEQAVVGAQRSDVTQLSQHSEWKRCQGRSDGAFQDMTLKQRNNRYKTKISFN